jgi:hypothetical protein
VFVGLRLEGVIVPIGVLPLVAEGIVAFLDECTQLLAAERGREEEDGREAQPSRDSEPLACGPTAYYLATPLRERERVRTGMSTQYKQTISPDGSRAPSLRGDTPVYR